MANNEEPECFQNMTRAERRALKFGHRSGGGTFVTKRNTNASSSSSRSGRTRSAQQVRVMPDAIRVEDEQ